jgi:DNA (cytosine-5)-methyltransferase 1
VTYTITDLFCGAGGSSSGAIQVPGVRVRMAANHWKLAVDTHNTNHPDADHDCADISQTDPRRYPTTDILWASPECTNHSQAKGTRRANRQPDLFDQMLPDEAAERSRATMFDVLRFAEIHRYKAVIVENVVDVRDWVMWPAWRLGLNNLGYDFEVVYLNSMFAHAAGAPAPQSRDRLYIVAWQARGRRPDLDRWTRPRAHCPVCDRAVQAVQAWKRPDRRHGRYKAQYVYRCPTTRCHTEVYPGVLPAAVAIDWTLAGERIGDRAKPLAAKTRARIEAGLARYARPIHLEAAGNTFERRPGVRAWPVDEPLKTMHTTASKAVACPPFLTPMRSGRPRTIGVDQPVATVVADGSNHGLVKPAPPMLVPAGGTWNDAAASVVEPFRTRTTRDTEALVVPLRNNGVARPADTDPAPTVAAAGNHHALVMRNMTARGDQGQMSTPVEEPLRTQTASSVQSLIRWGHLLVPYYGTAVARRVDEPVGTVTTVDRNALVGPQVDVDDCTFRMLEPHEIQLAMAFDGGYVVLGNKRERVRQLGNAVTPPAARDLIAAVVEALSGEPVEAVA